MNFTGLADFSNANNRFDFKAEVIYADLNKLNFVKRDAISIFKGEIEFNIEGNTLDDMAGEINFENTNYINQNDSYFFDDFQVTSVFKDSLRVIEINSPDIITGYVKGNFKVKEVGKVLENQLVVFILITVLTRCQKGRCSILILKYIIKLWMCFFLKLSLVRIRL